MGNRRRGDFGAANQIVIYDLKKMGYKIESKMVEVGNGKHVAQYRLLDAEKDTSHSIKQGTPEAVRVS